MNAGGWVLVGGEQWGVDGWLDGHLANGGVDEMGKWREGRQPTAPPPGLWPSRPHTRPSSSTGRPRPRWGPRSCGTGRPPPPAAGPGARPGGPRRAAAPGPGPAATASPSGPAAAPREAPAPPSSSGTSGRTRRGPGGTRSSAATPTRYGCGRRDTGRDQPLSRLWGRGAVGGDRRTPSRGLSATWAAHRHSDSGPLFSPAGQDPVSAEEAPRG